MRVSPKMLAAIAVGFGLLLAGIAQAADLVDLPDLAGFGKTPLRGDKLAWVQKIVGEASDTLRQGNTPRSVAFGQAAVETGWGTSGAADPWGERGAGDAGSDLITTHEVIDGQSVKMTGQKFAHYSSLDAAAKGYIAFLDGKSYRPGHPWRQSDPGRWLLWLWAMGYATATHYPSSVVDASRKIAVTLNDPTLAVHPWTAQHEALASQLADVAAGSGRRKLAGQLLGLKVAA